MTEVRDYLIKGLMSRIKYMRLNGHPEKRLPNNINLSVEFIEGESMLMLLDAEGIAASSGSACTSKALKASHVLLAIGVPHEICHGSMLFSLNKDTSKEDADYVIELFPIIVERLRKMSPLYKG
jgi:cysteine desulfurase